MENSNIVDLGQTNALCKEIVQRPFKNNSIVYQMQIIPTKFIHTYIYISYKCNTASTEMHAIKKRAKNGMW